MYVCSCGWNGHAVRAGIFPSSCDCLDHAERLLTLRSAMKRHKFITAVPGEKLLCSATSV
jgi:hypothetical protein